MADLCDELARLDPKLNKQQRCRHQFPKGPVAETSDGRPIFECAICAMQRHGDWDKPNNGLPLVGDGANEERYNSIDALIRLCGDLGFSWDLHGEGRSLTKPLFREDNEISNAVVWLRSWRFIGVDNDPRIAFATALLSASENENIDGISERDRNAMSADDMAQLRRLCSAIERCTPDFCVAGDRPKLVEKAARMVPGLLDEIERLWAEAATASELLARSQVTLSETDVTIGNLRRALSRVYPSVARRVIALQQLGEISALAEWQRCSRIINTALAVKTDVSQENRAAEDGECPPVCGETGEGA